MVPLRRAKPATQLNGARNHGSFGSMTRASSSWSIAALAISLPSICGRIRS